MYPCIVTYLRMRHNFTLTFIIIKLVVHDQLGEYSVFNHSDMIKTLLIYINRFNYVAEVMEWSDVYLA